MASTTDLARSLLVAWLVVSVAGCALPLPFAQGSGPCGLVIQADVRSAIRDLSPPYTVEMAPPSELGSSGPSAIVFSGTGWQDVRVAITDPRGRIQAREASGEDINGGFAGFIVDAPGTWHFLLTDDRAGCRQEFTVAVRPPSTP